MRQLSSLAATVFAACFAAGASAAFVNGSELQRLMNANDRALEGRSSGRDTQDANLLTGYVLGVVDAGGGTYCLPKATHSSQIVAIVKKHLKENPERWGESGDALVASALTPLFGCKK